MGPPDDVQLMSETPRHLRADHRVIHGIPGADTCLAQCRELLVGGPAIRDGHGREVPALLAEW